jgi:cephalosporin hydroxylase
MYMEQHLDLPAREVLRMMQARIMQETSYFGIPTLKNPLDFWVYREIIFEARPDVIVEIGNFCGGSTLALAHICDNMDSGRVVAIDLSHQGVPKQVHDHPRVALLEGDAVALAGRVAASLRPADKVLVIEDSAHTYDNTLAVLRTYAPLVTPGSWFIVEDGICHHGLEVGPAPGPYEAVESFLAENDAFVLDRTKEGFFLTWNPKGFLRRRA